MNYYPFHIGDYSAATRHLSWDEDAAYRRLLDVFYTTEKPLPAELRAVCRLVLATSDAQRQAVQAVLEEFWTLTESGWINKRAVQELERMRERQSASDEKNAHERERMRRHRDRRAELFEALRSAGVTPAWDISMADLQRLYNAHCSSPATDLKREQVVSGVAPATAIPTPTPTPKETPPPPKGEVVDNFWFTRWWEAWPKHPRKAARVQCERKWQALGCEAMGEQIVASVEAHKASAGWAKDDGAFVPAPLVWLNQRRWEAPIAAPKKAEVWVPPPPMSAAERAAADEVRRRVVTALRGRVAA